MNTAKPIRGYFIATINSAAADLILGPGWQDDVAGNTIDSAIAADLEERNESL